MLPGSQSNFEMDDLEIRRLFLAIQFDFHNDGFASVPQYGVNEDPTRID